jgi:hypothetical protein
MNMLRVISALILLAFTSCIRTFIPASTGDQTSLLVVDGTITPGAPIFFSLSRTKSLLDTVATVPEENATVQIEAETGEAYPLLARGRGMYSMQDLAPVGRYRLRILTSGAAEYLSEFVDTKISPPIDSVNWKEDGDIFISVSTHDDNANTRFYRWQYEETSEYHAVYDSNIDFINGELLFIGPEKMRFACYKEFPSNAVLIGTSGTLGQDVISSFPLAQIPNDNSKVSFRYSMLVKQLALTAEAYQYWQIVKQNSEQTGNLFDPQPAQLYGNIHCISNPGEPVIGFVTASTVSEKRIFIRQSELNVINYPDTDFCDEEFIDPATASEYLSDGTYMPAYYRMSDGFLAIAPRDCVDCRLAGGTTMRPSFW